MSMLKIEKYLRKQNSWSYLFENGIIGVFWIFHWYFQFIKKHFSLQKNKLKFSFESKYKYKYKLI